MAVMNVKRGTTDFAKTEQTSSMKTDAVNQNAAQEFKKAFGDQDLGQVLNKVADSNWIDPTKKARGVGNPELGKDAFMKMMLTQMKNQDPTNPTPSHEMAAQLAQFSSLEQLNNINQSIEGLAKAQAPNSNYQALAFIGKKVSGDSSKVIRGKGDTTHGFSFDLMGDATKVKVSIKDAQGATVRQLEYASMPKGKNAIEWNGLQTDGTPARAGEYRFQIEATSPAGTKVYAKTSFEGRITGLNYSPEGPILMIGDQQIKMSEVKKIEEMDNEPLMAPGVPLQAQALAQQPGIAQLAMAKAAQGAVPKHQPLKPEAKAATDASKSPVAAARELEEQIAKADLPAAEEADFGPVGNIDDVPMSQDLINQIAKETK